MAICILCMKESINVVIKKYSLNILLPAGQFFAPKLIILIKCFVDILFLEVLF